MSRKGTNSSQSNMAKNVEESSYYVSEYEVVLVSCAQFYKHYFMLCTNNINIYDMESMKKVREIKVKTHSAAFVPFSQYILYVGDSDREKREMVVFNYQIDKVAARVNYNFGIQEIKVGRRVVSMVSLEHLYVVHFPTLKPIFQGFAGNGVRLQFDVSMEGLTLVHSTRKKGEIVVRNFTNIETNKLLVDVRQRSRGPSAAQYFRPTDSVRSLKKTENEEQQQGVKKEIFIEAHSQNVSLIRLCPNGYRLVSACIRGTSIKMFSCLTGDFIAEYNMSDICSPIVDIRFIEEGNQIVCLNENNNVNLFYTKMLELELLGQSSRKGYQIYQQDNPTSFFSFLGFISQRFKNQYPFANKKLNNKELELNEEKAKIESELIIPKNKDKITVFQEIKEVNQSHGEQGQMEESFPSSIIDPEISEMSIQINAPSQEETYLPVIIQEVKPIKEEKVSQNSITELITPFLPIEKQRKGSNFSLPKTNFKAIRPHSISRSKQSSIKSAGKLNRKATELMSFGQKQRIMHFRGTINFGQTTNIQVFQSKYIFHMKYDPFNGGEMVTKSSVNLLKHPLFADI